MIKKEEEYIKKFWVGLFDGIGSIQINHWKEKKLKFRLVIKLNYCLENIEMLKKIKKIIGGYIKEEKSKEKKYIIWIVDNEKEIENIINIFNEYPLLLKQKKYQLAFLQENLKRKDVVWYLKERENKYIIYKNKISESNINQISYFREWFSGFIEAEGCFFIKKKLNHSFSFSQKFEENLLYQIKNYFNITTKVKESKKDRFIIEVYKKTIIQDLLNHFKQYPLLGEKQNALEKFKIYFQK